MQQESNITLEILIHDYLKKRNYTETANKFQKEANIPDYNPKDCIPILFEWFNAFNDIYNVRSGRVGCQENLARIENVMLKLENEKRRYRNMDSTQTLPPKSKSIHEMSYTNMSYEYATPKVSDNSGYDSMVEKRSFSEAFDRRNKYDEKMKGVGNVKQYYGRGGEMDNYDISSTYGNEAHKYMNSLKYPNNTLENEKVHGIYNNEYQRQGYIEDPRAVYNNEDPRVVYNNEDPRVVYNNEAGRPLYKNDINKQVFENEAGRLPYDTGRIYNNEETVRMPYNEVDKLGYPNDTVRMPYNTDDTGRMPYNSEETGRIYSNDKGSMMNGKYNGDFQKAGYPTMKYQNESNPHFEGSYTLDEHQNNKGSGYNDRYASDPYKNYECLKKIKALQLHKQRINALCVSNKHNIFITGGYDQSVNIVDIRTYRTTRIDLNVKIISDIKINDRENELLIAADNDIYIYKLGDYNLINALKKHTCTIKSICIDGDKMFTLDVEGTLKKWKNYELVDSVDLHVNKLLIFNGVLVLSDRSKVFTYNYDSREVIDLLYNESAFVKVYDNRLMLFLKTKVIIMDQNYESINVVVCNEKVQSGCILSDNGILLGVYQGMIKHINNEMFNVNSEGNVMILEKYVKENEIVIGGCYDGSVVLWEHH